MNFDLACDLQRGDVEWSSVAILWCFLNNSNYLLVSSEADTGFSERGGGGHGLSGTLIFCTWIIRNKQFCTNKMEKVPSRKNLSKKPKVKKISN